MRQAPTSRNANHQGEWSDWVAQPPPEPARPPAPDYFRHEAALAAMIDRSGSKYPKKRWVPVLLGSVGAAALIGAAYVQFRPGPPPATVAASSSTMIAAPSPAVAPVPTCPDERIDNGFKGSGAGGVDSGPAAIFAFQYAYYVTRSGDQARAVVAPNASVSPADTIQQGIDGIPAGTTHCVTITPGAFTGQYLVQVTEHRPGAQSITYTPQLVTTARSGSKTLITGIGAAQ